MIHRYPSLNHLRTFEVAARHLSFKKAALELNVTPAAIGQRVRALEEQLGLRLFKRKTRSIALTEQGQYLALYMRDALASIDAGLAKIRRPENSNTLSVSTTPVFAERWLLNKLPEFNRLYPDANVQVIADAAPANFEFDGVDFAIRFGAGDYPNRKSMPLLNDVYIPVCHPDIARIIRSDETQIAKNELTFIHCDWVTEQGSAPRWEQWFREFDVPRLSSQRNLTVSMESLAIQAALTGQGIALVHRIHVLGDLETEKLVIPFNSKYALIPDFRYYFVEPKIGKLSPMAEKFKIWLIEQIKSE